MSFEWEIWTLELKVYYLFMKYLLKYSNFIQIKYDKILIWINKKDEFYDTLKYIEQ